MKIGSLKSTVSELDEQLRQTSSKFVSCRDTTLEKEAEANKMRLIAYQAERSVEDCQRQLARKNDDLRENDENIRSLEQKIGTVNVVYLVPCIILFVNNISLFHCLG
jgi:chromosome segregation ATPase